MLLSLAAVTVELWLYAAFEVTGKVKEDEPIPFFGLQIKDAVSA
jgi:hypothetical protein